MSSYYSCKFNQKIVKKLSKFLTVDGVAYIEEECLKEWSEHLNGELGHTLLVSVDATKLLNTCHSPEVSELLGNVPCINFEFDPKKDMEQTHLKEKAPIGVWIKSSDIPNYDFNYLEGVDVLLRRPKTHYWYKEKRLNVTMDFALYTVGFLDSDGNIWISANDEDNIPLDSCDCDIMVIKLDTNK